MRSILAKSPLIAILRHIPPEQAEPYAASLLRAGVRAVEVALNSAGALEEIALLKSRFGDALAVGAGTAVTVKKAQDAVAAGADFLLSPSSDGDVLRWCAEKGVRLLPGVLTPSDVSLCLRWGFSLLKLFPAGDFPPHYIRSLKGPFDETDYVAVGGVSLQNVRAFFEAGFLGVGVGSNLVPKEALRSGNWDQAEQSARAWVEQIPGLA